MSEKPFDFFAKWDDVESRRFMEALKRKKIAFCEEHGLPVPAFDKEEDFFVTLDMFACALNSPPVTSVETLTALLASLWPSVRAKRRLTIRNSRPQSTRRAFCGRSV